MAQLINAPSADDIVWTRGTTEAINPVAQSYLRPRLQPGDEISVSEAEHHANLIPADGGRANRRAGGETADRRRSVAGFDAAAHPAQRQNPPVGAGANVQRHRRLPGSGAGYRAGACRRRTRDDRRRSGRGSRPGRRTAARHRFLRLLPATSCMARPASARCTAKPSCWRRWRRGKAAARC